MIARKDLDNEGDSFNDNQAVQEDSKAIPQHESEDILPQLNIPTAEFPETQIELPKNAAVSEEGNDSKVLQHQTLQNEPEAEKLIASPKLQQKPVENEEVKQIQQNESDKQPLKDNRTISKRCETKWKEYLPIFSDIHDYYLKVFVQWIYQNNVVSAMCKTYEKDFENYCKLITNDHKNKPILTYAEIHIGDLIVIPFESDKYLYRAIVLGKAEDSEELLVHLIDRGNEFMLTNCSDIKEPAESAYSQKRFSFKVQIDNLADFVLPCVYLEIQMNMEKIGSTEICVATMKLEKRAETEIARSERSVKVLSKHIKSTAQKIDKEIQKKSQRFMIEDIETTLMPFEKRFSAKITDLSVFIEHRYITIYELIDKHKEFYDKISDQIASYINCKPMEMEPYFPL